VIEPLKFWRSDNGILTACYLSWLVLGLLPAIFFFRFFFADGAFFFLQILEGRSVFFPAEGRAATYLLTQWPAPMMIAAGCRDIQWLAWFFGAGLMLMPALIHGTSILLLLRRKLKLQALVYIMMLWLLMGYGGLCIVTDSHTPTAIFLLAVVLAVSSVPERIGFGPSIQSVCWLCWCGACGRTGRACPPGSGSPVPERCVFLRQAER